MATYFIDPVSGNNVNDGLTFANRKKTITSVTPAAGDIFKVIGSPAPTSLGQSATWTQYSPTVTLTTPVTANISTCDTAWTGAVNVTATVTSSAGNYKEGTGAANLVVAAGFTTGMIAFQALGGVTDFSAYDQISLWAVPGAATTSFLQLNLCSDALGLVPVNTLTFPANLFTTTNYHAITLNNGGPLGNAIQSVSLSATSDPGAVTIRLDNIIACKSAASADSLTLTSLISPQDGMSDTWYALQSINGTNVILGGTTTLTSGSANLKGYSGTTKTVTTYKRECLYLPDQTGGTTSVSSWAVINGSGTAASPITISGGWDRTAMSTQDLESFIIQSAITNTGLSAVSRSFINIERLHFIQFASGMFFQGCSNINIATPQMYGHANFGINCTTNCSKINITSPRIEGIANIALVPGSNSTISSPWLSSNLGPHMLFDASNNTAVTSPTLKNGTDAIVSFGTGCDNIIYDLASDGNTLGLVSGIGQNYLIRPTVTESSEYASGVNYSNGRIFSHNHDVTANNHKIFMDGGLIISDTGSDRHTPSGIAWKMSPTSANRSSAYPMELSLAKIACRANKLVTVRVWEKRTTGTITARLICKGGQIAGVPADVVATAAGADNTYEQISITFTPTETGVVEIMAQAYGGTTDSAWFDDMTIYQS